MKWWHELEDHENLPAESVPSFIIFYYIIPTFPLFHSHFQPSSLDLFSLNNPTISPLLRNIFFLNKHKNRKPFTIICFFTDTTVSFHAFPTFFFKQTHPYWRHFGLILFLYIKKQKGVAVHQRVFAEYFLRSLCIYIFAPPRPPRRPQLRAPRPSLLPRLPLHLGLPPRRPFPLIYAITLDDAILTLDDIVIASLPPSALPLVVPLLIIPHPRLHPAELQPRHPPHQCITQSLNALLFACILSNNHRLIPVLFRLFPARYHITPNLISWES